MYLDERLGEILAAHGMSGSEVPLFLKYIQSISMQSPDRFRSFIASFFEVSSEWLAGVSDEITESINSLDSLQNCLRYLVQGKRAGWKPKIVFVKPLQFAATSCTVLLEFLKITKTGIACVTYKQWEISIFEELCFLCEKAGLYYRGISIDPPLYQALEEHRLLPVTAIKMPRELWYFEEKSAAMKVKVPTEINHIIDELRCLAIEPTHLPIN